MRARASEREGRAGGSAGAEAGSRKGRRRAAEGSLGGGGSSVGARARRSTAAVRLRGRAAALSLAVGGDRGREKGSGRWPRHCFRGLGHKPLPRGASEEEIRIKPPFRGAGPARGRRRRCLGPQGAGPSVGGPGAGAGKGEVVCDRGPICESRRSRGE